MLTDRGLGSVRTHSADWLNLASTSDYLCWLDFPVVVTPKNLPPRLLAAKTCGVGFPVRREGRGTHSVGAIGPTERWATGRLHPPTTSPPTGSARTQPTP